MATPETDALAKNLKRDNSPEFDLLRDLEEELCSAMYWEKFERSHKHEALEKLVACRAERDALAKVVRMYLGTVSPKKGKPDLGDVDEMARAALAALDKS